MIPSEQDLVHQALSRMRELVRDAAPKQSVTGRVNTRPDDAADLIVEAAPHRFVVEVKAHATLQSMAGAWKHLQYGLRKRDIPVVVVPYVSPGLADDVERLKMNWADLSGNAVLRGPGIYVRVSGQPNRFPKRGRPASVFERRGSRLVRALLVEPGREWTVREVARATGVNEGHVSRIVQRLVDDELVIRRKDRRFSPRDPLALLEAWRASGNFRNHQIYAGHVAARTGTELLQRVAEHFATIKVDYAATGLAAAWQYDHFAMFRLVTVYTTRDPTDLRLEGLGFRGEVEAPNLWITRPNDDGVFYGARDVERIRCVHPVQAYIDLKDHPERAREAAEHLKLNALLFESEHAT